MSHFSLTARFLSDSRIAVNFVSRQVEIVRNACEIVHLLTDSNPIQVIVDAVINRSPIDYAMSTAGVLHPQDSASWVHAMAAAKAADSTIGLHRHSVPEQQSFADMVSVPTCSGPREDATRIGSAGVVRRQAVDISPLRRVNQV